MKSDAGLKLDIARSCFVSPVEAVQGDGSLRSISVELTDSGKPWYPPAGTEISVAYVHSNGTKGLYNKLPDGRKAVTVRDNVVTVILASQIGNFIYTTDNGQPLQHIAEFLAPEVHQAHRMGGVLCITLQMAAHQMAGFAHTHDHHGDARPFSEAAHPTAFHQEQPVGEAAGGNQAELDHAADDIVCSGHSQHEHH